MKLFDELFSTIKMTDTKEIDRVNSNKIASENNDGAIQYESEVHNFTMNLDWKYGDQAQLLDYYREVSNYQEVDYAIEDIVNEAVSFIEGENAIDLNLEGIDESILTKAIKTSIYRSWDKIINLLDLNDTVHQRLKEFYVDGRLAYQKVVDPKKTVDGIIGIITLDPKNVTLTKTLIRDDITKTIKKEERQFFYSEVFGDKNKTEDKNKQRDGYVIHPDALSYVTSGLIDNNTGYSVSWLHKAVKPANQLRLMENSILIYRITRAPERRIFNVSTGGLPKQKSEQYIKNLASSYRNKMSYNPDTGSFNDARHLMTMQEDFWFAKDASGKGTDVTTLQGGQNLGDIEDIKYFQRRLYKALNVPVSRLESEAAMQFGKQSEITRDELKFSKFVSKVRKRFNLLFLDLLRTELILTKVITAKEWEKINQLIEFKYSQDLYLEEQKKQELFMSRVEIADASKEYIGKYFSHDYVQKTIFGMTEEEMKEQDVLIAKEKTIEKFKPQEEI